MGMSGKIAIAACAAGALIGFATRPAIAQGFEYDSSWESVSPPMAKECPGIRWLLKRGDGVITGYAGFIDLSGVSKVSGTYDASGKFQLTLTSLNGKGPEGKATGERDKFGSLNATLVGPGCSNLDVRIDRAPSPPGPAGGA